MSELVIQLAALEPPPSTQAFNKVRDIAATPGVAVIPNAVIPRSPALGVRERTTQRGIDRTCTYVGSATVE